MKKVMMLTLIALLIIMLSVCEQYIEYMHTKHKNHENGISKYTIDVEYNREEGLAWGRQELIYTNNTDTELKDLVFHIYPNAYRKLSTVPAIGKAEKCFPEGFNPGSIDIWNVCIDGKNVKFKVDNMVMTVLLDSTLKRGSTLKAVIDFKIKIPVSTSRFGSYKGISQFVYWYPILAVYDNGWQIRPYNVIGESNYSDVADYDVNISTGEDEVIASTGSVISEERLGKGRKRVAIKAERVRDFVWIASKNFKVERRKVDGIEVLNYYTEDNQANAKKADDIAEKILKYYNDRFGKYPYKEFDIVETNLTGGSMEYPQLIAISANSYKDEKKLEHAIAHETAHQWWYSAVGNDQHFNPWLDEGFAVYFSEDYWGFRENIPDYIEQIMEEYRKLNSDEIKIDRPVSSFANWRDYNEVVYKKGALMLHDLRKYVGEETFNSIIREYYSEYKFKNARPEDFIKIAEKYGGRSANACIEKYIHIGIERP